jgi:hypothetical protein
MGQTQSIAVEIVINVATSDNPLGSFKKEWLLIRKKHLPRKRFREMRWISCHREDHGASSWHPEEKRWQWISCQRENHGASPWHPEEKRGRLISCQRENHGASPWHPRGQPKDAHKYSSPTRAFSAASWALFSNLDWFWFQSVGAFQPGVVVALYPS